MTPREALVIFVAAFVAGAINSIAGGGTLLTFPALVWIGRDPIIANATNAVALWPGSLAGAMGFRRELARAGRWALWLTLPSCLGGALGAVLLLRTPSRTFATMVPWLILFATALFAAQRPIQALVGRAHPRQEDVRAPTSAWWMGAAIFQFVVAVYGGYFGAGMGIVMLAALGLLGLSDIFMANGLKNLFAVCINGIAAVYFVAGGAVRWGDALVMAAGAIAGGYGGAGFARRLGRSVVHRAVIAIGIAAAASMVVLLRRG
ncbi:MAG: sulfite exporter TauE/SafE family protein [Candidatus Binatia bacterium]